MAEAPCEDYLGCESDCGTSGEVVIQNVAPLLQIRDCVRYGLVLFDLSHGRLI